MSVTIMNDGNKIDQKWVKFSDGASNLKIEVSQINSNKPTFVTLNPTTDIDSALWELLLVSSALESVTDSIHLRLPYLPHGRADRVFEEGSAFPLQMFLSCLYGKYSSIFVIDPHSTSCSEFFTDIGRQWSCVEECVHINEPYMEEVVLICPDKGAVPKIQDLKQQVGFRQDIVYADKVRDATTGRILKTTLPEGTDLTGKTCLIVDDICDGGGTFIPLAEALRKAGARRVELYVTHGIFSKGLNVFKGHIDKIYSWHTVGTYINQTDILHFNENLEVK